MIKRLPTRWDQRLNSSLSSRHPRRRDTKANTANPPGTATSSIKPGLAASTRPARLIHSKKPDMATTANAVFPADRATAPMCTSGSLWLAYAFITVAAWGLYGNFLHSGQMAMEDPSQGRYKAFLWGLPTEV